MTVEVGERYPRPMVTVPPDSDPGGSVDEAGLSPAARFAQRFARQRVALSALIVLVFLILVAAVLPLVLGENGNTQTLADRLQGPSVRHLLGADELGRDQLVRLLVGVRTSLLAAGLAVAVALLLGVPLGLLAGFSGGWIDAVASRLFETIQSVPGLILAIAIVGILGRNLASAMIAIGIVFAPRFFRVLRSVTLVVARETYVEAARSIGGSHRHILLGHVLPNVLSPLLVQLSLTMAFGILGEAALSFVGLGVQPPDSSLGNMLASAVTYMDEAAHLVLEPGMAIFALSLCFSLVGDAARDAIGRGDRSLA
jgi:ABC-type dipeptide/oligopeptide/nickel transport system permease subunit